MTRLLPLWRENRGLRGRIADAELAAGCHCTMTLEDDCPVHGKHPTWPCPTYACPGDARYVPPGRGHSDDCTLAYSGKYGSTAPDPAGTPVFPGNSRVWCPYGCGHWREVPSIDTDRIITSQADHMAECSKRPQPVPTP